ncbi:G protein [Eptesicus fuscus rhabdovirus]|uniref:G protein n=1 Tax=Eptesicus fuscus rhabdovirus TaxID=2793798 RepID=A0A7T1NUN7_9RHAB|nr:G protein [Eptesicus fuscus rhabdovirus]
MLYALPQIWLFLVLWGYSAGGQYSITVPTKMIKEPTPINFDQLECHVSIQDSTKVWSEKISAYFFTADRLDPSEKTLLCTGWEYVTRCYEYWYGGVDVTHIRRPAKPDLAKCTETYAQNTIFPDEQAADEYSPPECHWLRSHDVVKKVNHAHTVYLKYDFYDRKVKDERLVAGECEADICPCVATNQVIFRPEIKHPECSQWKQDMIQYRGHEVWASSEDAYYILKRSCDVKLCGRVGKIVDPGIFISLDKEQEIGPFAKTIPCANDVNVTTAFTALIHQQELYRETDLLFYEQCMSALDLAKSTHKVTLHMYQALSPSIANGRIGPVYSLRDGKLYAGLAQYQAIQYVLEDTKGACVSINSLRYCLARDKDLFVPTSGFELRRVGEKGIVPLTNGIYMDSKNMIHYPTKWGILSTRINVDANYTLPHVPHFTVDHKIFRKDVVEESQKPAGVKHFEISNLFSGSTSKIITYSVVIFLFCLTLLLGVCCIPWARLCRRKISHHRSGVDTIALRELNF